VADEVDLAAEAIDQGEGVGGERVNLAERQRERGAVSLSCGGFIN
jgi:hypothetical protein